MINFSGVVIKKIKELVKDDGITYGEFSIGPIPQGYGYTLANSLRRVLLSSIPGYSITSVRVNDLTHEFTTIPGVKENVLDIVLRLKKIRFRVKGNEDMYVVLGTFANKVGEFKAGDLEVPSDVEIINKDFVIATVTDKSAAINLEGTLEKGIGYRPADDTLRDEIGRIPTDAVFSPVNVVSFEVVPSRKGGVADYDKVIMKIETDGSVCPEDALVQAISILQDFYKELKETPVLLDNKSGKSGASKKVSKQEKAEEPKKAKAKAEDSDVLNKDIASLSLSPALEKKLKGAKIKTLGDLVNKGKSGLLEISGVGDKALGTIEKALKSVGLKLA